MLTKSSKPALKILLGVLMLAFTAMACNNEEGKKKDAAADTTQKDTATTRPVIPPN